MPRVKNQLHGSFRRSFRNATSSLENDHDDDEANNNHGGGGVGRDRHNSNIYSSLSGIHSVGGRGGGASNTTGAAAASGAQQHHHRQTHFHRRSSIAVSSPHKSAAVVYAAERRSSLATAGAGYLSSPSSGSGRHRAKFSMAEMETEPPQPLPGAMTSPAISLSLPLNVSNNAAAGSSQRSSVRRRQQLQHNNTLLSSASPTHKSLSPSPSECYEMASMMKQQQYRFSHQSSLQQQQQRASCSLSVHSCSSSASVFAAAAAAATARSAAAAVVGSAAASASNSRRTSRGDGSSSSCTVDALVQQQQFHHHPQQHVGRRPPHILHHSRRKSSVAHQQLFQTQLSLKEQQRKPDILWRYDDDNIGWYITYGDGDAVTLLHTKRERTQMKNFATEIRALQDMEKFLTEATILLDVDEFQPLDKILLNLSHQMLTSTNNSSKFSLNHELVKITTTASEADESSPPPHARRCFALESARDEIDALPSPLTPPPPTKSNMKKKTTQQLLFEAQKDTTTTLLTVVTQPSPSKSATSPPLSPADALTLLVEHKNVTMVAENNNNSPLRRLRSNTMAAGASHLFLTAIQQPAATILSTSRRASANFRVQILPTIAIGGGGGGGSGAGGGQTGNHHNHGAGGVDGEPELGVLLKEVEATLFAHAEAGELARQLQGVVVSADGVFQGYDQSWICVMCNLPSLQRRRLGIARLRRAANFGSTCQECQYIILVFSPLHEKATKTALETGRTFSTIFADMIFRHDLLCAKSVSEFRDKIRKQAELLAEIHAQAFEDDDDDDFGDNEYDNAGNSKRRADDFDDDLVGGGDISIYYGPESDIIGLNGASTVVSVGDTLGDGGGSARKLTTTRHSDDVAAVKFNSSFRNHPTSGGGGMMTVKQQHRRRKRTVCELLEKRPGRGLQVDFFNRIRVYADDFRDGFVGANTIRKVISTTCFLYFACLLPTIAFGTLHHSLTNGQLGVRKAIIAQAVGGLVFSICGGQPLVVLLTTAPLALYIKVIFNVAEDLNIGFLPLYGCVGLWNALLLVVYSVTGACQLMKWSTRSTEEIFALFVSITFTYDAIKAISENFKEYFYSDACEQMYGNETANATTTTTTQSSLFPDDVENVVGKCHQEVSLLYLLLLFGTVLISLWLYTFNKTPYMGKKKRELLTDYSLPLAVMFMSFIGSYVFRRVEQTSILTATGADAEIVALSELKLSHVVIAFGLSVPLSLLFYIDQNVSSAMVNSPVNKLRKPPAYHLDLLIVGLINALLSCFGLPWLHGALPHSPMHVHCLAEMEQRVEDGHAFEIVIRVRETRVTTLISHIFIALSLLLLPYPLAYIPPAVLNGLFLYMAFTALNNLDLWERICSSFYEKRLLPPQTYFRHVPLLKINLFTILQLLQLLMLCAAGFAPVAYAKMCFPVLIMILIPIRQNIIPKIIEPRYLACLDGHNV